MSLWRRREGEPPAELEWQCVYSSAGASPSRIQCRPAQVGEPTPTVLAGPGGGKAVHHEQIIARPDQPGPWKGVSALIAGS